MGLQLIFLLAAAVTATTIQVVVRKQSKLYNFFQRIVVTQGWCATTQIGPTTGRARESTS